MEDNGKHFSFEEGCLLLKQAKYKYKYDNCEVSSHTIYIQGSFDLHADFKISLRLSAKRQFNKVAIQIG